MSLFIFVPIYLVFHMIVGAAMGAPDNSPRNPEAVVPNYSACVVDRHVLDQACVETVNAGNKETK